MMVQRMILGTLVCLNVTESEQVIVVHNREGLMTGVESDVVLHFTTCWNVTLGNGIHSVEFVS